MRLPFLVAEMEQFAMFFFVVKILVVWNIDD